MTARSWPTWSDIKGKLADFDRQGLIGPVQDMDAASRSYRTSEEHLGMATELVISNALRWKRTVESYQ